MLWLKEASTKVSSFLTCIQVNTAIVETVGYPNDWDSVNSILCIQYDNFEWHDIAVTSSTVLHVYQIFADFPCLWLWRTIIIELCAGLGCIIDSFWIKSRYYFFFFVVKKRETIRMLGAVLHQRMPPLRSSLAQWAHRLQRPSHRGFSHFLNSSKRPCLCPLSHATSGSPPLRATYTSLTYTKLASAAAASSEMQKEVDLQVSAQ